MLNLESNIGVSSMFEILAAGGAVPPIFVLLTLVLSSVVIVSLLCARLKQSLLVGYFICGLILSNSGILDWAGVGDTKVVQDLSEIQVGLCIAIAMGVGVLLLNLGWRSSLLLGFMVCLSSTAVSLKTFQDLGLPESPQARVTLGMALFQDLMTILFMVLLPVIVSESSDSGADLLYALLKGIGFTVFLVVISRFGLPQMLDAVAKSRSRELFTVTIFFVSVGGWILLITVALILLKGGVVFIAARLSGLHSNRSFVVAAALCSMGEFSIVVLNRSMDLKVFDVRAEQLILASTALSMALVPTLMKLSVRYCKRCNESAVIGRKKESEQESLMGMVGQMEHMENHVIICGYGPVGQNLHANLDSMHIPVVILEMNPETVKMLLKDGHFALFADARDREGLMAARVEHARGLAVTFPDKAISLAILHTARAMHESLLLYARCKFKADMADFEEAEIDHILLDEEHCGRAMIKRVMLSYSDEFNESWI